MYQWIFWRHAEAGFARDDLQRPLTERGQQQAQDSAQWLKQQDIDFPAYCSQAVRGQQTIAHYRNDATILAGLNPGNRLVRVRETIDTLAGQDAIIVGHLPWINQIVNELLKQRVPTYDYSSICCLEYNDKTWRLQQTYRL